MPTVKTDDDVQIDYVLDDFTDPWTPPEVVLLSVVVLPWHSVVAPVIGAGTALTVTVKVPRPIPVE